MENAASGNCPGGGIHIYFGFLYGNHCSQPLTEDLDMKRPPYSPSIQPVILSIISFAPVSLRWDKSLALRK